MYPGKKGSPLDPRAVVATALVVVGGLVGLASGGQTENPRAALDAGQVVDATAPDPPPEDSGPPKPYDHRPVIRLRPQIHDDPAEPAAGQCWVNGHQRRGTWVSGYFRRCR